MSLQFQNYSGIEKLIDKYKKEFRIRENINHYTYEDYLKAEKVYVRFCLKNGRPYVTRSMGE